MNILDENVPDSQRRLLRRQRRSVQQIGDDTGRKGMKDDEVIALLHQLDRPTLFTLDGDFYDRRLCHQGYCLVFLGVGEDLVADYIRRFLRHRAFNTRAKRLGTVVRILPTELTFWRRHQEQEDRLSWK